MDEIRDKASSSGLDPYGGGSWGTELFPIPLLSIPVVKGLAEMWLANWWVFGKLPLGSDAVGMALIGPLEGIRL